jgi:hypothetical protein
MRWRVPEIASKAGRWNPVAGAAVCAIACMGLAACGDRSDLGLTQAAVAPHAASIGDAGGASPGSIDVHLVAAPGVTIVGVGFSIANPAIGFTNSGAFPLSGSTDFSVKGLQPAAGYRIMVQASREP